MEAFAAFPPTRTGAITVPLDHFRYNLPARTFGLRYATYEAFAANESTAPILFYCGNEGAIELFYNATGAIFEHAKALKARAFFIEHRYYGNSLPLGPKASFTPEGLQFLTIEQALADYANVITSLPKHLGCVGTGARRAANRCDIILFGGSYGGMLLRGIASSIRTSALAPLRLALRLTFIQMIRCRKSSSPPSSTRSARTAAKPAAVANA